MLKSESVESPCISICVLDEDQLCQGCFRTLQEIGEWSVVDDKQKATILAKSLERKEQDSLGA